MEELKVADSSGTNPFMGRGLLGNPMAMFQREGAMTAGTSETVAPPGMTWNLDMLRAGPESGGFTVSHVENPPVMVAPLAVGPVTPQGLGLAMTGNPASLLMARNAVPQNSPASMQIG